MNRLSAAKTVLFFLGAAPFCMPLATLRGAFYGEFLVAVAGLVLVLLANGLPRIRRWNPVVFWLLGLAILWGVNGGVKNPFWSVVLWQVMGFLLVAAMVFSIQTLMANEDDRALLWLGLLQGIWLGSLVNALAMVMQLGISIADDNSLQIMGLLGQRSLAAEYLCLGLVASVILYARGALSRGVWAGSVLLLAFMLPLTTARAALAFLLLMIAAAIGLWRYGAEESRRMAKMLFGVAGLALVLQMLTPVLIGGLARTVDAPTSAAAYGGHSGISRLLSGGQGYGLEIENSLVKNSPFRRLRFDEGRKAFQIAVEHPWFGVGSAMYGRWSAEMQQRPKFIGFPSNHHYDHAHNLILQLFAEQGFLGGGLILAGLVALLWRGRHAPIVVLVGGGLMLGIMLGHSMTDFPLWHLQFFAIFAVMLAFVQPVVADYPVSGSSVWRYPLALLIIAGGWAAIQCYSLLSGNIRANFIHAVSRQQVAALTDFREHPLVDMYATGILIGRDEPAVRVQGLDGLLKRFNQGLALPQPLMKEAVLLAKQGRIPEAQERIRLVAAAFPFYIKEIPKLLTKLSSEQRAPLLDTLYATEVDVLAGFARRGLGAADFGYETLPPRDQLEFSQTEEPSPFGRFPKPQAASR